MTRGVGGAAAVAEGGGVPAGRPAALTGWVLGGGDAVAAAAAAWRFAAPAGVVVVVAAAAALAAAAPCPHSTMGVRAARGPSGWALAMGVTAAGAAAVDVRPTVCPATARYGTGMTRGRAGSSCLPASARSKTFDAHAREAQGATPGVGGGGRGLEGEAGARFRSQVGVKAVTVATAAGAAHPAVRGGPDLVTRPRGGPTSSRTRGTASC